MGAFVRNGQKGIFTVPQKKKNIYIYIYIFFFFFFFFEMVS